MRQISPDKKRTYVYSKTQGRFNPNVKAFFYQEGVFKKITSTVPENSPETADVLYIK